MLDVSISSDLKKLEQSLDKLAKSQMPYATMLTLNRLASFARDAIRTNMNVVFDRPTPYTLNSLFIRYATKSNLTARVEHKDFGGKGTPASKYLRPEIQGGTRSQKRSEIVLGRLAGVSPAYWTPGRGATLNAYGNVSGSTITQILSAVQGLSESGFKGNRTAASAKRKGKKLRQFFIMPIGNPRGLKPGVYERKQGTIVPVLFLDSRVTYTPRYDMQGVASRVVAAEFSRQFAAQMDYALSTAKVNV